jgi:DNA adenine methylase
MAFRRYLEPFLGGGSVFLGLGPPTAVLSDANWELIVTYSQVRYRPKQLKRALQLLGVSGEEYRRIRAWVPRTHMDIAVRFLYLNRTAFGGMYRLNRQGHFNVPFGPGRTPATLYGSETLDHAAQSLRGVSLSVADFEGQLDDAGQGDLVYCDPTYSVVHNDNGFVRYNEAVFKWEDQARLVAAATGAASRGALVLVSNADHEAVRELYEGAMQVVFLRESRLCPRVDYRRLTSERLYVLGPASHMATIASRAELQGLRASFGVERVADARAHGSTQGHYGSEPELWVGHGVKRCDRR